MFTEIINEVAVSSWREPFSDRLLSRKHLRALTELFTWHALIVRDIIPKTNYGMDKRTVRSWMIKFGLYDFYDIS